MPGSKGGREGESQGMGTWRQGSTLLDQLPLVLPLLLVLSLLKWGLVRKGRQGGKLKARAQELLPLLPLLHQAAHRKKGGKRGQDKKAGRAASLEDCQHWARHGFTSLVVAAPGLNTQALLTAVLPLLAPSAPFAIFHNYAQPLAEAMMALQKSRAAVALQLSEPWLRHHQMRWDSARGLSCGGWWVRTGAYSPVVGSGLSRPPLGAIQMRSPPFLHVAGSQTIAHIQQHQGYFMSLDISLRVRRLAAILSAVEAGSSLMRFLLYTHSRKGDLELDHDAVKHGGHHSHCQLLGLLHPASHHLQQQQQHIPKGQEEGRGGEAGHHHHHQQQQQQQQQQEEEEEDGK
eukprot:jgi/Mesen1/3636/ME000020S03167